MLGVKCSDEKEAAAIFGEDIDNKSIWSLFEKIEESDDYPDMVIDHDGNHYVGLVFSDDVENDDSMEVDVWKELNNYKVKMVTELTGKPAKLYIGNRPS